MSHRHLTPDGLPSDGIQVAEAPAGILRPGVRASNQVLPVELFFDLVYVLAITQLTRHLLEHLTLRGAGETLVLFLAVWLGWIQVTWITNYFDLHARGVRLVLIGLALASLIMSASLLESFNGRGVAFGGGFAAVLTGGAAFGLAAVGRRHHVGMALERVLIWTSATGLLFVAGGFAGGDARILIWLGTIVGTYFVIWLGFPLPVLGHSHTNDYTISGEHLAERCLLFVTIALGESIVITGSNFGELPTSTERWVAFVVAFIGSAAIWWIYFDRGADAAREVISAAEDPGRVGLIGYAYCHIPIVFGIIVAAAGDEIAIAHPGNDVTTAEGALILGGPALYLLGHNLFKLAVWGHLSPSRLAGLCALGALAPLAMVSSALMLIAATTLVLVGVVAFDLVMERRRLVAESQAIAAAVEA